MDLTTPNQTKPSIKKGVRKHYCSPGLFLSVYDTQLFRVTWSVFHRDLTNVTSQTHSLTLTNTLLHTHLPLGYTLREAGREILCRCYRQGCDSVVLGQIWVCSWSLVLAAAELFRFLSFPAARRVQGLTSELAVPRRGSL